MLTEAIYVNVGDLHGSLAETAAREILEKAQKGPWWIKYACRHVENPAGIEGQFNNFRRFMSQMTHMTHNDERPLRQLLCDGMDRAYMYAVYKEEGRFQSVNCEIIYTRSPMALRLGVRVTAYHHQQPPYPLFDDCEIIPLH